jgi:hypothetical protein
MFGMFGEKTFEQKTDKAYNLALDFSSKISSTLWGAKMDGLIDRDILYSLPISIYVEMLSNVAHNGQYIGSDNPNIDRLRSALQYKIATFVYNNDGIKHPSNDISENMFVKHFVKISDEQCKAHIELGRYLLENHPINSQEDAINGFAIYGDELLRSILHSDVSEEVLEHIGQWFFTQLLQWQQKSKPIIVKYFA